MSALIGDKQDLDFPVSTLPVNTILYRLPYLFSVLSVEKRVKLHRFPTVLLLRVEKKAKHVCPVTFEHVTVKSNEI